MLMDEGKKEDIKPPPKLILFWNRMHNCNKLWHSLNNAKLQFLHFRF